MNVIHNAFKKQLFLSTLNSAAMNHVLPKCSIRSDQTKAPILGGLWIFPPMYIQFSTQFEAINENPQFYVHYGQSLQSMSSLSSLSERLSIYQSTISKNLKLSNKYNYKLVSSVYHSQQGRRIINTCLEGLQHGGY